MDAKFHNLSLASATHLATAGLITRKHRDQIHAKVNSMKRAAMPFGSMAAPQPAPAMGAPGPMGGPPPDPSAMGGAGGM